MNPPLPSDSTTLPPREKAAPPLPAHLRILPPEEFPKTRASLLRKKARGETLSRQERILLARLTRRLN